MKIEKQVNWTLRLLLYFFVFGASINLYAQSSKITGTVIDGDTGEGIPGVTILVKDTSIGTITDVDGNYVLEASGNVLVFSFVGYRRQEVEINNRSIVNVGMEIDITALGEVIVTGYGTQKKSVVTGSISKINTATLARSKDLRIEQALQGKAAGVVVMNNSGQPGDNLSVIIRGIGTNGNPDPLFIVDGLPIDKRGLDIINPSDISSIEVLKDATASAIYGTRAANGVVIVTTKNGSVGQKMTVSYDGFTGVQNPWRKLDLLNTDQYIEIINEAAVNDGKAPVLDAAALAGISANTDWQEEMFYRNAPKSSHTVSFSGGSENGTYFSSLNYFSQDGIVAKGKSNYERISYKLNSTKNIGKLKLGGRVNFASITSRGIDANTTGGAGLNQAINTPSIIPIKFADGAWGEPNRFGFGLQEISNPVAELSVINREFKTYKGIINVSAEYELIKGLTFKTNYGTEVAFIDFSSYTPKFFINATKNRFTNAATQGLTKSVRWNWDNTLTYNRSIDKHNITALIGTTQFKEFSEDLSGTKDSLIFDTFDKAFLNNSTQQLGSISNGFNEHTLQSYFGRLYYNLDERYLLEAVVRVDGSSRFGVNNRYAVFPAFAGGWVFTKEKFFPSNSILEFGKLRSSWGKNGNENISDFQFTSIISNNHPYFFGTNQTLSTGIQPAFYPNPSLRWEASQQFDIGLDLSFFSGKVSMAVDYYKKSTEDWLISGGSSFPLLVGNSVGFINGGGVSNQGFELELGYKSDLSEKLFVDLSLTAATNKSEVTEIRNDNGVLNGAGGFTGQDVVQRLEVGQPIGYFWGFETAGIIQHPAELEDYPHLNKPEVGDLIFVDQNGDEKLNDEDKINLGNPSPKVTLGLSTNFEYGSFDLGMFWYSALGQKIWNASRRTDLGYSNYTTDILNRWTGEGTSNTIPKVTISDNRRVWRNGSDFYVEDADFLRLKNITLGYTINDALAKKMRITKLRVYVTSENLLTFTKYSGLEVEIGGTPPNSGSDRGAPLNMGIDRGIYPQSKTFLGGVSITF